MINQGFRFVNLLGAVGRIRRETLEGREHLVVPAVALVEGVIRAMNSKKPELVPAALLRTAPQGWNGRPLFAGHPVEGGKPISGNDPRILERAFGKVFNTVATDHKLEMELWLDVEKARSMPEARRVLERCEAHERGDADAKPLEVSVGANVGVKAANGSHNGRAYEGEWSLMAPDHVALLAEHQVGACSVAMGCGVLRAAMLTEDGLEDLEGEEAIMKALRDISQEARDQAETSDFAGPNRSFPILKPADVAAAAHALGRAKGDRDAIRRRIISIAKRKGEEFMAKLPEAWAPQPRQAEGFMSRLKQRALELFRLAQTPDEMSDDDLRDKLSKQLAEADADFVTVHSFWPISDPTHVVYTTKLVKDVQPDPLPYPGYVDIEYSTYERPFDLADDGAVTLGAARIKVMPVVRWEPADGAVPEQDYRAMAAQLYDLAGRRHSAADESMLQSVHDLSTSLGATCAESRIAGAHECACRNRNLNTLQGGDTMDRTKAIAALAAHPHAAIKDTKILEKLEDAALKALEDGAAATGAAIKAAKDGQATAEVTLKAAQDALAAPVAEDRLPADYRTLMADHRAAEQREIGELVVTLKAAQSAYTEEELKKLPLVELRKLAAVAKVQPASHAGRGVPRALAAGADAPSFKAPDPYAAGLKAARQPAA